MALSQGDVDEAVLFAKVTSVMTFISSLPLRVRAVIIFVSFID